MARSVPELLTKEENEWLLKFSENLVKDIIDNDLGGYSGVNRPFHVKFMMEMAIEKLGHRDTGLNWSYNQLKEIGLKE